MISISFKRRYIQYNTTDESHSVIEFFRFTPKYMIETSYRDYSPTGLWASRYLRTKFKVFHFYDNLLDI